MFEYAHSWNSHFIKGGLSFRIFPKKRGGGWDFSNKKEGLVKGIVLKKGEYPITYFHTN